MTLSSADHGISTRQAETWRDRAACAGVDPTLFYPAEAARARRGKQVCRGCPVWRDCLADTLERKEPHGIRGGLTDVERRELTLQQRRHIMQLRAVS